MITYRDMRALMDAIREDGINPLPAGLSRTQEVIRLMQGPDPYPWPLPPEYVVRPDTLARMELAARMRRVKVAKA